LAAGAVGDPRDAVDALADELASAFVALVGRLCQLSVGFAAPKANSFMKQLLRSRVVARTIK
jgi:hypothetical protein